MIHLDAKINCCGCNACSQICPKECIRMQEDKEGFLYPSIIIENCIDCGLCEQVCPVICQKNESNPLLVYAAKHKDLDIRMKSSSGGVFTSLAEYILSKNGVVFGAKFNNNWEVVHDYTENIDDLSSFRGSKYVQSKIGECYKQAEAFLKAGRKVLFTGTPCQIAGLKFFLRREFDNLLTVDFICHGTPSPMVWRRYLDELLIRERCIKDKNKSMYSLKYTKSDICDIEFRNKIIGWRKYSFVLTLSSIYKSELNNTILLSETVDKNVFLQGFLADLYLRPSCHFCPVKSHRSGSDITIADFWSVKKNKPELDDDKGVSLITIQSMNGKNIYEMLELFSFELYDVELQKMSYESCRSHPRRNEFFKKLETSSSVIELITDILYVPSLKKWRNRILFLGKVCIKKILR